MIDLTISLTISLILGEAGFRAETKLLAFLDDLYERY